MNITNNFTTYVAPGSSDGNCIINGMLDSRCAYKEVFSQVNSHIIQSGIIIIVVGIIITWMSWWMMQHGWKLKIWNGYFDDIETRYYWNSWIRDKLIKLCFGYIGLVLYFLW